MAMQTSLESPAPVRAVANAISGWVDRLGVVWVEGQVAQLSRRPGLRTGLPHPARLGGRHVGVGDLRPDALRRPQPTAGRGRQRRRAGEAVVLRRPRHRSPSRPATSGRSDSASCSPGSSGAGSCWPPRGSSTPSCKRPLPFLPGDGRAGHRARVRRRARRPRERPPALAGGAVPGRHAAHAGPRRAAEVIEALQRLDDDAAVDVIVIARGGGSVEDLLPFSDEAADPGRAACPHAGGLRDRPRARPPLLDLVADVRASTPTDAAKRVVPDVAEETAPGRDGPRPARAPRSAAGSTASRRCSTAIRTRPALADPRTLIDARLDELDVLRDRSRRTLRHRLDRAVDDIDHHARGPRPLARWPRSRRGYAVVQDADGHVLTAVTRRPSGARSRSGSPTAGSRHHHPHRAATRWSTDDGLQERHRE